MWPSSRAAPHPSRWAGTEDSGASQFNWGALLLPFGIVAAVGVGIGAAVFFRRRSEVVEVESDEKSQ